MGSSLNRLVFQPPSPTYDNDPSLIWLTNSLGNKIPAFFVNRNAKLTVLFSHGNAEDLGMIVNYFVEMASAWNINVFAYDYSGYGLGAGTPSELAVYSDAEAAYDYVTNVLGVPNSRIVLYGRSLGSGPSCHLAANKNVRGLILQSPLASVLRVALNTRFSWPGDMFCNIDKVRKTSCPIFIIHGTRDEVLPITHAMDLYNASRFAVTPFWVEGAGHNNVEVLARGSFVQNVGRFLRFLSHNSDLSCSSPKGSRKSDFPSTVVVDVAKEETSVVA